MKIVKFITLTTLLSFSFLRIATAQNTPIDCDVTFSKTKLTSDYISEGAAIADMDGDGINDLIAGPAWWKGPNLDQGYSYAPVVHTTYLDDNGDPISFSNVPNGALSLYTEDFFVFPVDLDGNQYTDLIKVNRQTEPGYWVKDIANNPFSITNTTSEKEHYLYQNHVNCESPIFVDVIGDSAKELVSFNENTVTLTTPSDTTSEWDKIQISKSNSADYNKGHGLGAGDINGDGRVDVLVNKGWFEQPSSIENNPIWTFHSQTFANSAAQIQVFDVDGDGDNDVVTALTAHGYGMSWFENNDNGETFTEHTIMLASGNVEDSPAGVNFSQLHAMESADIDGDGVLDIVTGKCHFAHNASQSDPDPFGAPVLYWFKTQRNADGSVNFVPTLIDNESGVGRQISIGDINGDGKLDIATSNKKGVHAFMQDICYDSSNENLALSGTASQSTTDHGGDESRAIDGNTSGAWSEGSVTHTANEVDPTWEVDLGVTKSIGDIIVYGRTDNCCQARLSNFTVTVMDANRNSLFSQSFTSYPDPSTTINAGDAIGQIIQVRLDGTNKLSLAEVEIYEGAYEISNLALNGTASQSTTAYNGDESRAIDGNTNGVYNNNSVTHTEAINDSWWMVTLDNEYAIGEVVVYNRTNTNYMNRLNNFTVQVLNSDDVITYVQTITATPNPSVTINVGDVVGNRVRILQNNTSTALSLAEVEVYGVSSSKVAKSSLNKINEDTGYNTMFTIYPNPVKNMVTLQLETTEPAEYKVIDISGQVLFSGIIYNGSNTIDLSGLSSGIYTVSTYNESTIQTKKIIKE